MILGKKIISGGKGGKIVGVRIINSEVKGKIPKGSATGIDQSSSILLMVAQFRVVADTRSFFSMNEFEKQVLP